MIDCDGSSYNETLNKIEKQHNTKNIRTKDNVLICFFCMLLTKDGSSVKNVNRTKENK